jgi:ADP-ribose pyrophosphatase YjhB (NUDIX family)
MANVPMSPYVARLRALVGNELLHLPSVAALCRDDSGRILLVKQIDSGKWSTPGGAIEPGESPEQATIREVHEETGLHISVDGLRTAVGGPEYRTIYGNGDELSFVVLVYDATVTGGEPTPDDEETSDVGWFAIEELDELPRENFLNLLLRNNVVS